MIEDPYILPPFCRSKATMKDRLNNLYHTHTPSNVSWWVAQFNQFNSIQFNQYHTPSIVTPFLSHLINLHPASTAASASSIVKIVPHPIITSPSYFCLKVATCSKASGVVKVNSQILNPPSMAACMALGHASDVAVRRTAHARISANFWRTAS